jgi:UDP-N-acetylglucosamine:LPS N-acetylglucosamine transferase
MNNKIKIGLVGSAGGHLTELQEIFTKEVIEDNEIIIFTESNERTRKLKEKTYLLNVLRYNPLPYIPELFKCINILRKEKIDLIISNGAEVGMPVIIAAKILGIKTIYLDISAAAAVPTLAGKFSYPFSDFFFVQYPKMAKYYGKRAKYVGGVA